MALNSDTHSMVGVIIAHELKDSLRKLAESDHRSMSAEIVYILEQYLKEHGGE